VRDKKGAPPGQKRVPYAEGEKKSCHSDRTPSGKVEGGGGVSGEKKPSQEKSGERKGKKKGLTCGDDVCAKLKKEGTPPGKVYEALTKGNLCPGSK